MKKECWDALQRMKNDKSPGSDGLTKEFYVCFFNEVSNILITALCYLQRVCCQHHKVR